MSSAVLMCVVSLGAAWQPSPGRFDAEDFDPFAAGLERFVLPGADAAHADPRFEGFELAAPWSATATSTAPASTPLAPAASAAAQFGSGGGRPPAQSAWGPQFWISLGAYYVEGKYDTPNDFDFESSTGFALDVGVYNWRGEMGIGLEAGLLVNDYKLEGDAVGSGADTVDVWRAMLGLRIADRGTSGSNFIPYARAGVQYRRDDGGAVLDDGIGWYAGLGLDWKIADSVAIGPSVLYSENESQNSREWVVGLLLTIGL